MSKLDKLVTLIPMEELEQEAQQQIFNALDKPFLIKLAIMPDCHAGYDLPIGGVALLDNMISPSYVGYDIGCGMCFVNTGIPFHSMKDLEELYNRIKEVIPNGEGREQKNPIDYPNFSNALGDKDLFQKVQSKIHSQIGTLGGGNHFIEIGIDPYGYICVTIHSGSRNPGHSVGGHYMKLAKTFSDTHPEGDVFHVGSELGSAYLTDMNFMLEFALANRKMMMYNVLSELGISDDKIKKHLFEDMINENHNHAVLCFDGRVLHRKGATPADLGQLGVIPGNMRDGVYVTRGLGNETYLSSASHGAGRAMSRKKAKQVIDPEKFRTQMQGIVSATDASILDEAPDAYKDVKHVIELQAGIVVDILYHVKPIVNVKGSGSEKPWEKKKQKPVEEITS